MSDELERLTKLVHSKEIHPDFQYQEIVIKCSTVPDGYKALAITSPDLAAAFEDKWSLNVDRHTEGLYVMIDRTMTEVEVTLSLRRLKPER